MAGNYPASQSYFENSFAAFEALVSEALSSQQTCEPCCFRRGRAPTPFARLRGLSLKAVCPRGFPPSNYWVRTGPVHYSRHVGEGHHVEGLRSQLSGAADLYQTLGSWHCFCVYDVYYAHTHHGTSQDVSQGKLIFQVAFHRCYVSESKRSNDLFRRQLCTAPLPHCFCCGFFSRFAWSCFLLTRRSAVGPNWMVVLLSQYIGCNEVYPCDNPVFCFHHGHTPLMTSHDSHL